MTQTTQDALRNSINAQAKIISKLSDEVKIWRRRAFLWLFVGVMGILYFSFDLIF